MKIFLYRDEFGELRMFGEPVDGKDLVGAKVDVGGVLLELVGLTSMELAQ